MSRHGFKIDYALHPPDGVAQLDFLGPGDLHQEPVRRPWCVCDGRHVVSGDRGPVDLPSRPRADREPRLGLGSMEVAGAFLRLALGRLRRDVWVRLHGRPRRLSKRFDRSQREGGPWLEPRIGLARRAGLVPFARDDRAGAQRGVGARRRNRLAGVSSSTPPPQVRLYRRSTSDGSDLGRLAFPAHPLLGLRHRHSVVVRNALFHGRGIES